MYVFCTQESARGVGSADFLTVSSNRFVNPRPPIIISSDDRALPGHPRPHPPLHGVRGGADRFIEPYHAPRDPDFVGHPPIGVSVPPFTHLFYSVSCTGSVLTHHLPPPQPPREGAPLFLPYKVSHRSTQTVCVYV